MPWTSQWTALRQGTAATPTHCRRAQAHLSSEGEKPKEWWRYTFFLLLGTSADKESKPTVVLRCPQGKERYLSLHRLRLDKNTDRQELEAMESELPLEALVEFRKIVKRRRQLDSEEHSDSTVSKTWVAGGVASRQLMLRRMTCLLRRLRT